MTDTLIKPIPLNAENFAMFGEVVDTALIKPQTINNGYAQKFADVVNLDAAENTGRSALHIYIAKRRVFPLRIAMLEKHPYFSQTFIPQGETPFVCVVCPPADKPQLGQIRAFITNGQQGVHYARGTWHFPLIALADDARFFVIDRAPDNDIEQCIECTLDKSFLLDLEPVDD